MKVWNIALALLALAGGAFAAPAEKVQFTTEDGVTLSGTLTPNGVRYVVLSYQMYGSQYVWKDFAQELLDQGYSVLTYDYRGSGDSGGTFSTQTVDRDVKAAVGFLKSRGVASIAVIGCSIGASNLYKAALEVKATVLVSPGYTTADPAALKGPQGPTLFITSSYDFSRKDTESLFALAAEPKQLFIARGQDHGNSIIDGGDERVRPLIYDFLKKAFR